MARRATTVRAVPDPPNTEDSGGGGGNGGGDLGTRLTRLETHFQYLATKDDLYKWFGIALLVNFLTIIGHLLIRYLANTPPP